MAANHTKKRNQAQPDSKEHLNDVPANGDVCLEVSTRLPRRIRAGVTVTREVTKMVVTEDIATALSADPHITVTRL